jgi:hypothetical protein|tara:strand:- start:50 stop:598 length:549 start_codon:yes stop_codon:yes gene_type:complete
MKKLIYSISLFLLLFTSSCGIYKYSDAKKNPVNANERVKKNIEEGKGFRLGNIGKKGGDFMFASSNPLWRATMQKLSFAPLGVVDYGGGIIITDWFSEEGDQTELKIAVRFLTNEIRSDAIKVIIHKKKCLEFNNCKISTIENETNQKIKFAILKKAAELEKKDLVKTKEKSADYKIPGKEF